MFRGTLTVSTFCCIIASRTKDMEMNKTNLNPAKTIKIYSQGKGAEDDAFALIFILKE